MNVAQNFKMKLLFYQEKSIKHYNLPIGNSNVCVTLWSIIFDPDFQMDNNFQDGSHCLQHTTLLLYFAF